MSLTVPSSERPRSSGAEFDGGADSLFVYPARKHARQPPLASVLTEVAPLSAGKYAGVRQYVLVPVRTSVSTFMSVCFLFCSCPEVPLKTLRKRLEP